ncbi:MAG: hypothetical protein JO140_04355 [Candidatus Eremiobacteraeota bacterium]|nr:hypothetical protein [Candidatus Eremiobacteraeota bacterium]
MRRSIRKVALALCLALTNAAAAVPVPAPATLLSDPQGLYDRMTAQYETGTRDGWRFGDWLDYLSTVLDAGRAYSLRRPDDPNAVEVAGVAIDVTAKLRYDPLSNRDAAEWYVREAATKVIAAGDPQRAPLARDLLARLDRIEQSASSLARAADADASANLSDFPADPSAKLTQVVTTWKAWLLTKDPTYRSLALARAAKPGFPLANLSDPTAAELFNAARGASDNGQGYTAADTENGRTLVRLRAEIRDPREIARIETIPHDRLMTIRAPADEYFGRMGMSVIGIRNEIERINKYLDTGWGGRMASAGALLADAVDAWHREYPHDTAIPDTLLRAYKTLRRIDAEPATVAADRMRHILLVEYTDSSQARELLAT